MHATDVIVITGCTCAICMFILVYNTPATLPIWTGRTQVHVIDRRIERLQFDSIVVQHGPISSVYMGPEQVAITVLDGIIKSVDPIMNAARNKPCDTATGACLSAKPPSRTYINTLSTIVLPSDSGASCVKYNDTRLNNGMCKRRFNDSGAYAVQLVDFLGNTLCDDGFYCVAGMKSTDVVSQSYVYTECIPPSQIQSSDYRCGNCLQYDCDTLSDCLSRRGCIMVGDEMCTHPMDFLPGLTITESHVRCDPARRICTCVFV